MEALFRFLAENSFLLLFFTVAMAVVVGKFSVKGYGLGMVAAAIIVGCTLSVWASSYDVKLELNTFAKSLFYYLFMYGVGLRVGPSFINSLKGDGLKFTILAVVSCVIGLGIIVLGVKVLGSAAGHRGRHPRRLADDVGRDRLGRAGRHGGGAEAQAGDRRERASRR